MRCVLACRPEAGGKDALPGSGHSQIQFANALQIDVLARDPQIVGVLHGKPALGTAAKIARATTACLVCYEADHTRCHRTYVARAAHQLGAPDVKHLTARTATPDQPLRLVA